MRKRKAKIFISWSKMLSEKLAKCTAKFLKNIFGEQIEIFYSPEMYKGTTADNEIHEKLINAEKCIVCLTYDNFMNPWMQYESGVVYGANAHKKRKSNGILIPILFEPIPDWSSWIDKPLNRYVPIKMYDNDPNFICNSAEQDFTNFVNEMKRKYKYKVCKYKEHWRNFHTEIAEIIESHQSIPADCRFLYSNMVNKYNENFCLQSPEVNNKCITFYKGFLTSAMAELLYKSVTEYQSRTLWIWGRTNKKYFSSEYKYFFEYLNTTGIDAGVDYRCFFVAPSSNASLKSFRKEKLDDFDNELKSYLRKALKLQNEYKSLANCFKVFFEPRKTVILVSDNSVIYRHIRKDSDGYALPSTDEGFNIVSRESGQSESDIGYKLAKTFDETWDDNSKSAVLTPEYFFKVYGEKP